MFYLQWIAQKFSSPFDKYFFFSNLIFILLTKSCNIYLKSFIFKDTHKPRGLLRRAETAALPGIEKGKTRV